MGSLKDFYKFLEDRRQSLARTEKKLLKLQEKYEEFFGEVERVRRSEFDQLDQLVTGPAQDIPGEFRAELDQALSLEEQAFDKQLAALVDSRAKLLTEAEQERTISRDYELGLRQNNAELDSQEEELKGRSAQLLKSIERYNDRIRELGRGFGFFRNLFRMRRLQVERKVLDRQQADLAARIDALRSKWHKADLGFAEADQVRKDFWLKATTEAAALKTKIDYLSSTRARIVRRSALEKILHSRQPELVPAAEGDPACSRCGQANPASNNFCHICALRLNDDRPDFLGSLDEMAELNLHHQRFSDGMKACQEIIGLVGGLKSGLTAFGVSVKDMRSTQNRHNLKKLDLNVPQASIAYGQNFDQLYERVNQEDLSQHPLVFAEHVAQATADVYSEAKIKSFFETMGQELSAKADAQW